MNDWVSMKDQLPEIGSQIIAYGRWSTLKEPDGGLTVDSGLWCGNRVVMDTESLTWILDITHWQPLPKPPEQD